MVDHVFKDLEILDIFYENNIQKIFICRDKSDGEKVYVNSIYNKEMFDGINFQSLKDVIPSLKQIKEFSNKLFIVSKYRDENLGGYLSDSHLSLGNQFSLSEKIMSNIQQNGNAMPNFIVKSLINKYNIRVNEQGEIENNGLFILDEDADNAPNSFSKPLAEVIAYIFTGSDKKESRDEGLIPPDVREIIGRCKQEEYMDIDECIQDLKNSGVYGLVSGAKKDGTEELIDNSEDEDNQNEEEKFRRNVGQTSSMKRIRKPRKAVVAGIAAALLIGAFVAFGGMDLFKTDSVPVDDDNTPSGLEDNIGDDSNNPTTGGDDVIGENSIVENDNKGDSTESEEMSAYFNDSFIEQFEGENFGVMSDDRSHRGTSSVKVSNPNNEEIEYLVAGVDLKEEVKSNKNKKAELSYWIYTDTSQTMKIKMDYMKNGKVVSTSSKAIEVSNGAWLLYSNQIDCTKGDYVKISVVTDKPCNIWIDTINVGILK